MSISVVYSFVSLCRKRYWRVCYIIIYQQQDGLLMGAPTSPLIADIFMNDFETTVLTILNSKSPLLIIVLLWKIYVDDILCIWTGSERQQNNFLNPLNSLHIQLKFTIEIGNDTLVFFYLKFIYY